MANNCMQRTPLANKEWKSTPSWDTNYVLSSWMAVIESQTRCCVGEDMENWESLPAAEESMLHAGLVESRRQELLKRPSVEFLHYLAVLFLGTSFSSDKKQRPMHKLEHKYLW